MKEIKQEYDLERSKKPVEISVIPFVRLGYLINSVLVKTKIKPNTITWLGFVCGLLSALIIGSTSHYSLFGLSNYWQGLLGVFFGLLFLQADIQDGHLARAKNLCSTKGAWLDTIFGTIVIQLIMVAVIFNISTISALIWGLFAVMAYPLHFKFNYQFKLEFVKSLRSKKSILSTKNYLLKYLYGEGFFWIILLFSYIVDYPLLILYFYAVLGNLYWIILLIIQYKTIVRNEK